MTVLLSPPFTISSKDHIAQLSHELHESGNVSSQRLHHVIHQTVDLISAITEFRDPYTAGHQRRVAGLAKKIARNMRLTEEQVTGIGVSAELHDIGKLSIPGDLLWKPGKLTELEMALVKTHSMVGYNILRSVQFPWPVARIALQHHERKDGSGYPRGLAGDDILLEARVVGIADVADALSSNRSYRRAFTDSNVFHELEKQRGILFDEEVADACLTVFQDWKDSYSSEENPVIGLSPAQREISGQESGNFMLNISKDRFPPISSTVEAS